MSQNKMWELEEKLLAQTDHFIKETTESQETQTEDLSVSSGVCYVDSTSFIPFHPGVVDGDFTSPLVHSDTSTVVIVGDYGGVEGDLTAHVLDVYAVPCVVTGRGVNESKLFI